VIPANLPNDIEKPDIEMCPKDGWARIGEAVAK
jgi:hypothetical protein